MVRFDVVHAFGYNSAGSESIWMKFWSTLSTLLADAPEISGAIGAEARATERGKILFLSGK